MSNRLKLTPAKRKQALELYYSRLPLQLIAAEVGVAYNTLYKFLSEHIGELGGTARLTELTLFQRLSTAVDNDEYVRLAAIAARWADRRGQIDLSQLDNARSRIIDALGIGDETDAGAT